MRSRGGFSTKIHLRINGAGLPVAVDIAPGQASDYTDALPLLDADGPEPKVLLADRGYDADAIRTAMEARGVMPIIPMRRSRKVRSRLTTISTRSGTGSSVASIG